jgi:hypothetical protein
MRVRRQGGSAGAAVIGQKLPSIQKSGKFDRELTGRVTGTT